MIHSSSPVIEILRDSRINPAHFKISSLFIQCMQSLIAFPCKASLIQCIGIHGRHMGEHSSIFFMTIGKAKHSAQIILTLMEIRIQTISTCFCIIQIGICRLYNLSDLFLLCSAGHNGKYLSCQHHAYAAVKMSFYCSGMIIIIAVEPSLILVFYPFCLSDMVHDPF